MNPSVLYLSEEQALEIRTSNPKRVQRDRFGNLVITSVAPKHMGSLIRTWFEKQNLPEPVLLDRSDASHPEHALFTYQLPEGGRVRMMENPYLRLQAVEQNMLMIVDPNERLILYEFQSIPTKYRWEASLLGLV